MVSKFPEKRSKYLRHPNINLFSLLIDLLEKALIMLRSAVAIAGIIGAAISHRLLRHYLTSSKSQTHKPQSQDKNQNKAKCTEPEAMMSNSNGIDVLDDLFNTHIKLLQESHCYGRNNTLVAQGASYNSNAFDALEWRKPILGNVMEALADPNTQLIGIYGSDDAIKDTLLEKVYRRVQRNNMFGMVVRASITKYPDLRKIQENIASQLGLTFNHTSKDKRALELIQRIKNEQSILIVLRDLYKGFDLSKVGIPYGVDHKGCKVLLTSTSEDVLSNHIHTQKNFMV